jgi:hypothetical protein
MDCETSTNCVCLYWLVSEPYKLYLMRPDDVLVVMYEGIYL